MRARLYLSHKIYFFLLLAVFLSPSSNALDRIKFDLPPQDLANNLIEFAIQSNTQIYLNPEFFKAIDSKGLRGYYSVNEALQILLDDTNLTFSINTEKSKPTIIIRRKLQDINPVVSESVLQEEVIIFGSLQPHLYQNNTHSSFPSNFSFFDSSRYTSNLSKRLVQDKVTIEVIDILKATSSITPADGYNNTNDDFYVRGYKRSSVFWNGFPVGEEIGSKINPLLLENIEILKGPTTIIYGQAEPGGVINFIPKTHGNKQVNRIISQIGPEVHSLFYDGDNLSKTRKSKLSLSAAANKRDRIFGNEQKMTFFPRVEFDTSRYSTAKISMLNQYSVKNSLQFPLLVGPTTETISFLSPPENSDRKDRKFSSQLNILNGSYNFSNITDTTVSFQLLSEKREGVRGREKTLYELSSLADLEIYLPSNDSSSSGLISSNENELISNAEVKEFTDQSGNTFNYAFNIASNVNLELFNTYNNLLLGINYSNKRRELTTSIMDAQPEDLTAIDIYYQNKSQDVGIYLRNNIELNDNLIFSSGTRYNIFEGNRLESSYASYPKYKVFTSHAGLVYKYAFNTSFYINYSEGVIPNYIADDFGTRTNYPELASQVELGFKWSDTKNDLTVTSSVYEIDKKNIGQIFILAGNRFADFTTRKRVVGIDLDVSGRLYENLNIIASFSWLNTTVSSPAEQRYETPMVPGLSANLFARYDFLQGFSFDLTAHLIGDRYRNQSNSAVLSGYTIVDIGLTLPKLLFDIKGNIHLKLSNIFNQHYIDTAEGDIRETFGEKRSLSATYSLNF